MMYQDGEESDDEELRGVPRGVLSRVGVQMLEQSRASAADERKREVAEEYASIVDQSQFRNLEVGVGYQAKGVIRQPGLPDSGAKEKKRKKQKKKKHSKRKRAENSDPGEAIRDQGTKSYRPRAQELDAHPDEWLLPRRLARLEQLLIEKSAS